MSHSIDGTPAEDLPTPSPHERPGAGKPDAEKTDAEKLAGETAAMKHDHEEEMVEEWEDESFPASDPPSNY
jgi:hypothetical protein